ncbi:MAG: iron ABC transporter permease [Hyphomicrobiaceae bacterium]|nr:iron ABC transporter permease [Hyphomicrobiaceae bacterium]
MPTSPPTLFRPTLSLAAPRAQGASWLWRVGVGVIIALMLLPLVTLVMLALFGTGSGFGHIARTVLPRATWQTMLVLAGVGVMSLVMGTATAWLVTMHRFPLRGVIDRLLVLPLAIPTYIAAYTYVEMLDYGGPVQRGVRALFGFASARDYWFPDVRSLGGAIFILSMVLYPYVYLAARASFLQQSVCALEVARTLGRTQLGAFWSVALPLSRPALAAGTALALMETLNDFGAMQYLGVETLTVAVYAAWLQRGAVGGAAQMAIMALVLVLALVAAERFGRRQQSFHETTGRVRPLPAERLTGWIRWAATAFCLAPVVLGFVLPTLVLLGHAFKNYEPLWTSAFWRAGWHSLLLAGVAAVVTLVVGIVLAYARRTHRSHFIEAANTLIRVGYALPGTVLAVGLLLPIAGFDNAVDGVLRRTFGISSGLLLSGGIGIVVLAYVIRYLAAAIGTIEAGLGRLSPNLDAAARTLGETATSALTKVHLPLLKPTLGAAALLVFVDCLKELPATLLLRPFNFDTLATTIYSAAALEQFESAALGALAIVAVGLWPVLLLHRTMARGRVGQKKTWSRPRRVALPNSPEPLR